MSAISSQLSFRSSPSTWKFNARVFSIMDSIYAIAFGLGLRTLVDAVSHDFKLTGSLIGLWEGVITLHFLKKMPKSSDPYIAYGVRLFIDFLITESIERLVLVLIWTAFGMVLADVAPAIWDEVGLKRVWRHFRRDLYTIYDKIPTVAFFPPQRTVRFLPPRQREQELDPSIIAPSIATSQDTPITVIPPSSSVPSESLKHRVPGYYPEDYSDTDTDLGSISRSRPSPRTEVDDALGTTHYRLSTIPQLNRTYSVSDSDAVSSPSSDQGDIPDIEEEEQALVDVGIKEQEQEQVLPDPTTPKQKPYMPMPPTPSDSAARWDIHRDVVEDVLHAKPPPQDLPSIPDSGEDGGTSDDWEKIHRGELDEESKPPTPPAKDRPVGGGPTSVQIPSFPPIIPPIPPVTTSMDSLGANSLTDMDYSVLDSFSTPHVPSAVTDNRRESVPPPYTSHLDDFEEMYCNSPPKQPIDVDNHANVNEHVGNDNNADDNDFVNMSSRQTGDSDINLVNPWDIPTSSDATAQAQADAATKEEAANKQAEEAAERVRKEEEEERIRQEEAAEAEKMQKKAEEEKIRKDAEEKERIRKEEEQKRQAAEKALKEQQAEDARKEKEAEMKRKAEMKKKEDDDNALRKQRQAAERKKEEEAAAAKRQEEAEQKRKAEEKEEKEAAAAKEEAEQKRKDDEAEQKKKEDVAKKKEEIAKQKKKDEDAEALKRQKEEEEQEAKDTAEKQEAAKHAQTETEEAKSKSEMKEVAGTETEQADALTKQEKDDDSKTLHGVEISEAQHQQKPSETDNIQDSTTPPLDLTEEESVISTATVDPPDQVKVRLERMMILRAQMVEVEKRLDELEGKGLDENSPEIKAAEKTLRKFQRQADRRYAAGVKLARHLGVKDKDNEIYMEGILPGLAGIKLEEKLEQLLAPTSHSVSFTLFIAKKDVKDLKDTILNILGTYNLMAYTNPKNRKEYEISIPEEKFTDWLTVYRASVAKRDSENVEEGDGEGNWQLAH